MSFSFSFFHAAYSIHSRKFSTSYLWTVLDEYIHGKLLVLLPLLLRQLLQSLQLDKCLQQLVFIPKNLNDLDVTSTQEIYVGEPFYKCDEPS